MAIRRQAGKPIGARVDIPEVTTDIRKVIGAAMRQGQIQTILHS